MAEQCKRGNHRHRRGGATANLIALLLCAMVLAAIALPLFDRGHRGSQLPKDSTQIRGIHQSWLVYAREFDGVMPTPSILRVQIGDDRSPSIWNTPDTTIDTTANIHAMCLMLNYYSPQLCVSPTEPSGKVAIAEDYNYESYNVVRGVLWDERFKADLHVQSNVSYASMPLFGELRRQYSRDSLDSNWPMIGNRGPRDGLDDPNSITREIQPPHDQWSGNICFNDNHMEFFTGLSPKPPIAHSLFNTQGVFRYDGEHDADGILSFTQAMTPTGPTLQWD